MSDSHYCFCCQKKVSSEPYAGKPVCYQCKIRFEANWIDDLPLEQLPLHLNRVFIEKENIDLVMDRLAGKY
jgi:hypothetical protein